MTARIVMLVGAGGVGKDTLARELCKDDQFVMSMSWTTRHRRPGDDDDSYNFVTPAEFMAHVSRNGFLEWARYGDNLYGTPKPDPNEQRILALVVECAGASAIKAMYPETARVFHIVAPSYAEQSRRLLERGDDGDIVVQRLVRTAEEERDCYAIADWVVMNDQLWQAVRAIRHSLVYSGIMRVGEVAPASPFMDGYERSTDVQERILIALREAMLAHPKMRVGQLICNAIHEASAPLGPDLFDVFDEGLASALHAYGTHHD